MAFDDPWPPRDRDPLRAVLDAIVRDDGPPAQVSASVTIFDRPRPPCRPVPDLAPEPDPPTPRPDALRPEIALPSWRGYDPKALAGPRPYPWCPTPAACRVLIRNLGDPDRVPCRCREPGYRGP